MARLEERRFQCPNASQSQYTGESESPGQQRHSQGAALFEFPRARDCHSPRQHAPGSWRSQFEEQYADGEVFSLLGGSCRVGRQWALQTAPRAQLQLSSSSVQPAQLRDVRWALGTRKTLPTHLVVSCATGPGTEAPRASLSSQRSDTAFSSSTGYVLTRIKNSVHPRISASLACMFLMPNLQAFTTSPTH